MRYLILLHRYLGLAIGWLLVVWCLTGVVMMYVRYPELSQAQRLRQLPPLTWQHCCALLDGQIPDGATIETFQVENLGSRPVLHLRFADGAGRVLDLTDGEPISHISAAQAAEVARGNTERTPRLLGLISYDEWTVSGEFNRARPLYLFARDDTAGTQLYVSSRTGRVVQLTTSHQRFWNWIGAVPHWLYFAQLRRNAPLWNQVVLWMSLAGCFLTVFGIVIGVRQFLHRPPGRWSGYRGLPYWHHIPGLLFGLLALTWVASGLISMNPWGFLESSRPHPTVDALLGQPLSGRQVKNFLISLTKAHPKEVVALASTRLMGQAALLATRRDDTRLRVDGAIHPAPLTQADWQNVARTLVTTESAPSVLTEGDLYYASRPGVPAPLPVNRLILDDGLATRVYLDPVTGNPVDVIDKDARWYRWLHRGLHTLDFPAAARSRPIWDILMLALLTGVTLLCGTGTWLGWRRYVR